MQMQYSGICGMYMFEYLFHGDIALDESFVIFFGKYNLDLC